MLTGSALMICGIAVAVVSAAGAAVSLTVCARRRKRLEKQMTEEYGPKE